MWQCENKRKKQINEKRTILYKIQSGQRYRKSGVHKTAENSNIWTKRLKDTYANGIRIHYMGMCGREKECIREWIVVSYQR